MNSKHSNDLTVFNEALEIAAPEARAAYLDRACGADAALRRKIDSLLAAYEKASDRFEDLDANLPTLGPETTRDLEGTGSVIGRYKLLQKIGEGGCGVVYMAEQEEPVRRRVALKVIKLGMDTKSVIARFEAERQALAMMDHPNIAKIYDAGATEEPTHEPDRDRSPVAAATMTKEPCDSATTPLSVEHAATGDRSRSVLSAGRPYFVMELVRGVKITEYCDEAKLSTRDRLDLFIKVCQAIQHAHQKGIIHRDIKPSNILVTINDGVAVPKVIDFGIAKATEGRLTDKTLFTQFAALIGTPSYMSPEQAVMTSLDIDTRSDIYSLGVLLYELLAGSTPFDAKELMASGIDAMRKTIREKEPLKPSTKLSQTLVAADVRRRTSGVTEESASSRRRLQEQLHQLQGDLDWIVMKCLEKDRARRYETANGLASDIQRHLNNEAVLARPPGAVYRFQKLVRRNKLAFAAATAVAAALAIGLGAATVMFFRERLARNGEQQQRLTAQSAQKVAQTEQQRAGALARKSRRLLYAAEMNLAQQALNLDNVGRARRLLDRHRPQPGEEDLRGWEWRYLWQLTRSSALVTLTNRPMRGWSVSFSPDGTRLAVGWYDGHVDLWDLPGRRLLRALTDREYPYPNFGRVAFSPVRNLLAATSEPKVVTLYDLDSGRESILWRAPDQGIWEVRDLAFSQDGSRVVIYAGSLYFANLRATPEHGPRSSSLGDAVWVVDVSSSEISRYPTIYSGHEFHGAARLSPDNRLLYLARSDGLNYSIQCLDLATSKELWQTKPQSDVYLTTLAISPDGQVLASGSGFADFTIRVWDAATGRLLVPLPGHTGWVCKLAFTRDGRRLISAAGDQSIRFWNTSNWTEIQVLRGHTEAVQAVAISETAQLVASVGKDGKLMLWRDDGKSATDGYHRLPENVRDVLPLDRSHVLLRFSVLSGQPPALVDLKRDTPAVSLREIGSSVDVLGWFGTNLLCHWNGTNQVLVRELRNGEFIQRGAITIDSGIRPTGVAYDPVRQLLAFTEGSSSNSVYLASLAVPGRRMELKSDVPGLVPFRFSEDGNYLAAMTKGLAPLRIWNIETAQIVASINEGALSAFDAAFAARGRVLVVSIAKGRNHEIGFYDLAHPDRPPRRVPARDDAFRLAVSPDGGLVASSTLDGQVRLFDAAKGEFKESLHGHRGGVYGIDFSADGRRLISAWGGREAVKLWDVGTQQELLTLSGTAGSFLNARWSADGDVILAGPPWQAWRAPSWEEIAAAEAKDKTEDKQP